MKRLATTAAISTLALLASPSALAQAYQSGPAAGFYLGAGLGYATLDNDTLDELDRLGANTDDNDTAYKVFAGYDFNDNFSLEASYLDFGEATASASEAGDSVNIELGLDGFGLGLVGRLPIQNAFGIHAKLGMIAWDGEVNGRAILDGQRYRFAGGDDGTDPFYGIGAEYVIDRVLIRGEYERYDISDSGEDFTVDLASVSVGYLF